MSIAKGIIGANGFEYPSFNLEYQIERHLSMAILQWPNLDRNEKRSAIRRNILKGQCWLWPEPVQGELFQ